MKKYKIIIPNLLNITVLLLCIFGFLGFLLSPQTVKNSTLNGLIMCGQIIIPSIFPFSVLSLFIHKSNILSLFEKFTESLCFKIVGISSRCMSVFIISLIAGYPVGARLIKDMFKNNEISKKTAEAMLCYCVNSSPSFIIIAVGIGFFRSEIYGWILFAAHIVSAVLLCFLFSKLYATKQTPKAFSPRTNKIVDSFIEATYDSSVAVFSICSWVILFCVINSLLAKAGVPDILLCFFEVTTGCKIASINGSLLLVAFLLGWGGISVQLQVLSTCSIIKPRISLFVGARFLHGLFSAIIVFIINLFYKPSVMTLSNNIKIVSRTNIVTAPASIALLILCLVFLLSINNSSTQKS